MVSSHVLIFIVTNEFKFSSSIYWPFVLFLSEILDHISSPFYYWISVVFLFVCGNSLYIVDITLCLQYKLQILIPSQFVCLLNFFGAFHCIKYFIFVELDLLIIFFITPGFHGSAYHFLCNSWVSCLSCTSLLWSKDINPFSKKGSCSLNTVWCCTWFEVLRLQPKEVTSPQPGMGEGASQRVAMEALRAPSDVCWTKQAELLGAGPFGRAWLLKRPQGGPWEEPLVDPQLAGSL